MDVTPELISYVAAEIMQAQSQWEKENNREGGQMIWQQEHIDLLAAIAIHAVDNFTRGEV